MPRNLSIRCISELRDLFLLQVSTECASASLPSPNIPLLRIAWATKETPQIPSIIEDLVDSLSPHYPTVAIFQPTIHSLTEDVSILEVSAAEVGVGELPESPTIGEGEPVPPDSSFPLSITVGDASFDIVTYDGMVYKLVKDGEELDEDYPTVASAVGAVLKYVLHEIANQEGQRGTPHSEEEVDRDFLFEVAQFLRNSSIIPDDTVRKYLVDFVELTTRRDFNR